MELGEEQEEDPDNHDGLEAFMTYVNGALEDDGVRTRLSAATVYYVQSTHGLLWLCSSWPTLRTQLNSKMTMTMTKATTRTTMSTMTMSLIRIARRFR